MISQGFGEVSGRYFSPGEPNGAAGRGYISASPYQASLSCEIKSSMPCSRDMMNSACQENKHPVLEREDAIKNRFTMGIYPSRELEASLPSHGPWPFPAL